MKKLSILLIGLLLVAGFASAEVMLTLTGESTLTWGIEGNLIDDRAITGNVDPDFGTFADASDTAGFTPAQITLAMAAERDGLVIVAAQATFGTMPVDDEYGVDFDFIEFPNVVPGMLGITLLPEGTVDTAVTSAESETAAAHVLLTATPIEGLTAEIGFVFEQEELEREGLGDNSTWIYDNYIVFATSIFAEYELMLGEEDNVTVAVGTVFDSRWGRDTYLADPVDNLQDEIWAPLVVVPQTADFDPATVTLEANETLGFVSMPIGLRVGAEMAGLTAGVHFQTRLVQGADLADLNADGLVRASYALPIYVGVNVGYEMDMAGMTIEPNANFKYSSDFWKWDLFDDFAYLGNVSPAEFAGRPMSAGVGVKVGDIADGLLDVSLSGSAGFGDGEYSHGFLGAAFTLTELLEDIAEAMGTETTADVNDGWFAGTTPLVWKASLGLTATPTDEIKVTNTTSYTVDNLGVLGANGPVDPALVPLPNWGTYLNRLTNDTRAEYALMLGDVTAATFFGELNFQRDGFVMQDGTVLDTDAGEAIPAEQAFVNTLGYKIGVQVKVSTP